MDGKRQMGEGWQAVNPGGGSSAPTALLFSYHNWNGFRVAGMHKLAEALCERGFRVGFVNEGRSLHNLLVRPDDRYRMGSFLRGLAGVRYPVALGEVDHFSALDFQLPRRWMPHDHPWTIRLRAGAHARLIRRCRKRFPAPRLIVLESTGAVHLLERLRQAYPGVPVWYRPSDPFPTWNLPEGPRMALIEAERRVTREAELTLLPDEMYEGMYRSLGYEFRATPGNPCVLVNGIELQAFRERHPVPAVLRGPGPHACYVGGHRPDYDCLIRCARELPRMHFVVVCPEGPRRKQRREIRSLGNLTHIPGILPEQVPGYITNADVVLVAYARRIPNLHGKILQAMAAGKPVVAFGVSPELARTGIGVADSPEAFVGMVAQALDRPVVKYDCGVERRDWSVFKADFLTLAERAGVL